MTNLQQIFDVQASLQSQLGLGIGKENVIQWYNALTAAVLEIGEALGEDNRWKALLNGNNKKRKVNREAVIEEMADVFIYLVNACIFYNISSEKLLEAIQVKQGRNVRRLLACSKK